MGRRFWTVWVSSSASYLAEGLLFGALPVLAASLTRDARLIAVTDALHQAGWLLLGLVSGVAADVLPRLRIMWVANAVRAVTAGTFAALVAAGTRRCRSCTRWASSSVWPRRSSTTRPHRSSPSSYRPASSSAPTP